VKVGLVGEDRGDVCVDGFVFCLFFGGVVLEDYFWCVCCVDFVEVLLVSCFVVGVDDFFEFFYMEIFFVCVILYISLYHLSGGFIDVG